VGGGEGVFLAAAATRAPAASVGVGAEYEW